MPPIFYFYINLSDLCQLNTSHKLGDIWSHLLVVIYKQWLTTRLCYTVNLEVHCYL